MTLTLLLDLDGTLLGNEVDSFVTAYTRALAQHLAAYVDPRLLASALKSATQVMIRQQRPDATLQATFDAAFYPTLGLEKRAIQAAIHDFYAQVFPTLQRYTTPRPEAVDLVDEAFDRGYRVGIATNPLFPRTAIEQRLSWAGLPPDRYPFSLIPAYETFHFAKPNPAFFAEFLSQMSWPDGPVLMVGNDLEADINAACLMGLSTYLVVPDSPPSLSAARAPTASGSLASLLSWLDATPPESLLPDFNLPSAILATLQATPAALDSLSWQISSEAWTRRPQSGEWSLTEVCCHLRDVENEVNLPRFEKIIREGNPFLPGMDTDAWAEIRQYARQDGRLALQAFISSRLKLLDLLTGLSPADWKKPARHAIFGPTHLMELAGIAASHDRLHLQQIHHLLSSHKQ